MATVTEIKQMIAEFEINLAALIAQLRAEQLKAGSHTDEYRLLQRIIGEQTPLGFQPQQSLLALQDVVRNTQIQHQKLADKPIDDQEHVLERDLAYFQTQFEQVRDTVCLDPKLATVAINILQPDGRSKSLKNVLTDFFTGALNRIKNALGGIKKEKHQPKKSFFKFFTPPRTNVAVIDAGKLATSTNTMMQAYASGEETAPSSDDKFIYKEVSRGVRVNGQAYSAPERNREAFYDDILRRELQVDDAQLAILRRAMSQKPVHFFAKAFEPFSLLFANELGLMPLNIPTEVQMKAHQQNLVRDPVSGDIYLDVKINLSEYAFLNAENSLDTEKALRLSGRADVRFKLDGDRFKFESVQLSTHTAEERKLLEDVLMKDADLFDIAEHPQLRQFTIEQPPVH